MRPNVFTRTLISSTAVVGIVAAGLAGGAGTSLAASAPASKPAASVVATAPLAVVNLGLNTAQAQNVQRWLAYSWGYSGAIDGLLGTNSWMAFQNDLKSYWGYTGAIDGIVGSGTVQALQRLLSTWGYTGPIDGIAGSGTQAAFAQFGNGICNVDACI